MAKTRSAVEKSNICNALRKKKVISVKSTSPNQKNISPKKKTVMKTPVKSTPKKRKPVNFINLSD